MIRILFLGGLVILNLSCGSANMDPATPDGAHNKFVLAFGDKDYQTVYELLTSDTKADFHSYLHTTREVVAIIRSEYPDALKEQAIDNLSIPFKQDTFMYRDIESSASENDVFRVLCSHMFASKDETPSLMQKFGTKVQSIELEGPDKATIRTLAGESLVYIRETDRIWRTSEIFGINFKNLVLVSRQNLEITKRNVDIFSK
ncbi:hypothetical protein F9K33_13800 [bacterium]|nr:MAG: hypothetical protein F9K33_13800 [bacterium]